MTSSWPTTSRLVCGTRECNPSMVRLQRGIRRNTERLRPHPPELGISLDHFQLGQGRLGSSGGALVSCRKHYRAVRDQEWDTILLVVGDMYILYCSTALPLSCAVTENCNGGPPSPPTLAKLDREKCCYSKFVLNSALSLGMSGGAILQFLNTVRN